jgi:hypothetical protein
MGSSLLNNGIILNYIIECVVHFEIRLNKSCNINISHIETQRGKSHLVVVFAFKP